MHVIKTPSEILLHSHSVTSGFSNSAYEFIINADLTVQNCLKISFLAEKGMRLFSRPRPQELVGMLFELEHVRVNPILDNHEVIEKLTQSLHKINVRFLHTLVNHNKIRAQNLKAISDIVRFYLNSQNQLILLSPALRPKLISKT